MEEIFQAFPKLARFSRDVVISEKLDGTNAAVVVKKLTEAVADFDGVPQVFLDPRATAHVRDVEGQAYAIYAQSRTRLIKPGDDNYAFAKWVSENAQDLLKLGEGYHFGEWWGQGIQRNYGLKERRFSLFNVHRWSDPAVRPACCHVVPKIEEGVLTSELVEGAMNFLRENGSAAAVGFMKPEGIVIYHTAAGQLFKKTLEDDGVPKSLAKTHGA